MPGYGLVPCDCTVVGDRGGFPPGPHCPRCRGTGMVCAYCKGYGWVNWQVVGNTIPCPACRDEADPSKPAAWIVQWWLGHGPRRPAPVRKVEPGLVREALDDTENRLVRSGWQ